ncbi:hypothetical protein DRQ25_00260 [Candidatus Fermentibacteria bacterium]|nr:MAG: hypothetical protein DRQ25_00260 [Candidatus Fermentibacteria bacterium]
MSKNEEEKQEIKHINFVVAREVDEKFTEKLRRANSRRRIKKLPPLNKQDVLSQHFAKMAEVGILDESYVDSIIRDKAEILRKVAKTLSKQVFNETGYPTGVEEIIRKTR